MSDNHALEEKQKAFGNYLKKLRKSKKMTIRQLELYSGVSNAYLSHMENGKRGIPSPDILMKLSKPLGVDYEELMKNAGYLNSTDKKENTPSDVFVLDVEDFELTDEEIINKYNVKVDGKSLNPDQIKILIDIVRTWRRV